MNEELNDRLKSRITEVFDNFEDGLADEGWLLLREKYPAEEKRRPVIWLWLGSVAAILLVVLGIGIWLNNSRSSTPKNKLSVVKNTVKRQTDSVSDYANNQNQTTNQVHQDTVVPDNNILNNKRQQYIAHAAGSRQSTEAKLAIHKKANINSSLVKNIQPQTVQEGSNTIQPSANGHENNSQKAAINKIVDTVIKLADNSTTAVPAKTPTDQNKVATPIVKEVKKPSLFAQAYDEPQIKKQTIDPKVKFGVYAATYFNYAKGSDNEFNLGAGVSSEIKLTGRLKLLTGIAVGQNSFNYSAAIPQAANHYLAASIAAKSQKLYADAAIVAGPTSTFSQQVTPVLKNYQASLTGLDIPVNLKYQLSKSDTYISAGLSSGTYINETYQYLYTYSGTVVKAQDNNDKSQSSFSTFDFAKTLNLSFGMGYPLGKSNRLIIEPFLKYPLNGLGAQQIRFGASGVNLKLNFTKK